MAKIPKMRRDEARALRGLIRQEFGRFGRRLDRLVPASEMIRFRTDVDDRFRATTATLGAIHEEVLGLWNLNADVRELGVRLTRVEKLLGLMKGTKGRARAVRNAVGGR